METVINKLSEIEAAANRIMDDASTQKKEMAKAMEQQTRDFDAAVDKETLQNLEEIRTTLKKDMEHELSDLRKNTKKTLEDLDHVFTTRHDAIATKIYHKITRM